MKRLVKASFEIDKNIPLKNKLKQLNDISIHKEYIIKVSSALSKYLLKNGRDKDALQLMERAFSHDMSKLSEIEFYGMGKFAYELGALKNPKESISEEKEYFVDIHRKNNKHHPEYWDSTLDMTELDIMELCVDWCSRSEQFGSDVIEFLEERQETQFHFPKAVYEKIEKYLILITELIKKER